MEHTVQIRLEQPPDYRAVEELTKRAFWNHHTPGCCEHYLAHLLRDADCFLPELDFVAVCDGEVVGNIMYTRAVILLDGGGEIETLSFGPVSVTPERQGRGIGSALIRRSLDAAKAMGYSSVCIYGDPAYYVRFGFAAAERFSIGSRDGYYADALQALELKPGALQGRAGRFAEDTVYDVDEQAADVFDRAFPPIERKSDLPSQARFSELVQMRRKRDV